MKSRKVFQILCIGMAAAVISFTSARRKLHQVVAAVTEIEEVDSPYQPPFQIRCTAYCPCRECCGHEHGITRSGRKAVEGLTVASNQYYGKTVIIYDENMDYIGIFEVMDTGTDHLDIFMEDHERAKEFGVHYFFIQVVDSVG